MAEDGEAVRKPKPNDGFGRLWNRLSEASAMYGAIVGVVGLLVFAGLALASSIIYSPLGIDASEVGLSRTELLAQSAVFLLVVLVLALLMGVYVALFGHAVARRGTRFAVALLVGALAIVPAAFVGASAGAIVLVVVLAAPALLELEYLLRADREPNRKLARMLAGLGAFTAAAFLLLAVVLHVDEARKALADAARPPGALAAWSRLAGPWDAQIAEVTWPGDKRPREVGDTACLLYLGQANGTSVFVRPHNANEKPTVVRLPTTSIVMTLHPSRKYCREVDQASNSRSTTRAAARPSSNVQNSFVNSS